MPMTQTTGGRKLLLLFRLSLLELRMTDIPFSAVPLLYSTVILLVFLLPFPASMPS